MNERIEKLMDQSLNVNWYGFLDKDCVGQFTRSDLKKFAELIIRECAQVASDYDGAHYVGDAIEQHFGVE
jgi:hypothetical protein